MVFQSVEVLVALTTSVTPVRLVLFHPKSTRIRVARLWIDD